MRVVCLEQGDWQDPTTYPGAGPDWELLARKQWTSSPNVRRGPADYPIDLERSDMDLGNFNGVGGGTILYSAVWPRLPTVRLPHRLGARRRRRLAALVRGAPAVLRGDRPAVRRLGPRRQPRVSTRRRSTAAAAAHRSRRARARASARPPRLALVAGVQRDPLRRPRRPPRVRATRIVRVRLQRGRQGIDRRHPLAARDPRRRPPRHRCARARHRGRRTRSRAWRDLARRRGPRALPAAPTSCCARRMALGPRASFCCRRTRKHPTASPTPRDSWAGV